MATPQAMVERDSPADVAADAAPAAVPRAAAEAARARRWVPSTPALAALLLGCAITAALALGSLALYHHNERRLLQVRSRELGLVLTASLPSIQTPLASAAALADATHGDPARFRSFMSAYVGPGRTFASASLWPLQAAAPARRTLLGIAPLLPSRPSLVRPFLSRVPSTPVLRVLGLLGGPSPRIGYAFTTPGNAAHFVAYAESALPPSKRARVRSGAPYSDLDYAIYLGRTARPATLLASSALPVPGGPAATDRVPFGDTTLTILVTPRGSLAGSFFASVPWLVAVFGALITLSAATLTDRLARRRQQAERLAVALEGVAEQNRRMYDEQRNIAQTLQHALLPDTLPELANVRSGAIYVPAASGVDIGGDWYDLIPIDESRMLLVIGDVSGHGLKAATTMAEMRYSLHALAADDPDPAAVLTRLARLVNRRPHDYFATVLCALLDVGARTMRVASAGHLPPLLIDGDESRYVEFEVGVPVGVPGNTDYLASSSTLPRAGTLVAFTDGLVERRGEVLDEGLARLRRSATGRHLPVGELLRKLAQDLSYQGHHDDTAIVAIQWQL